MFLFKIVKNMIVGAFLLYGYNLLVEPLNMIIPINLYTLGVVTFLGIPGFIALILVLFYVF